jgi:ribosomal protein L12E/L44/L45/RPP1/RPP2
MIHKWIHRDVGNQQVLAIAGALRENEYSTAVITSRIQALVDMLKVNMSDLTTTATGSLPTAAAAAAAASHATPSTAYASGASAAANVATFSAVYKLKARP